VSAEAAADFAALLAFGSRSTLEADLAAAAPVVSRLFDWVSADAAADFSALLAFGSLSTFEADRAAPDPVLSLFEPFAMAGLLACWLTCTPQLPLSYRDSSVERK